MHTVCWVLFKGFISIYKTNKNSSVSSSCSVIGYEEPGRAVGGGEKAFSADAATDLARVTAATHPTLQLRVVSPQHRTPQKAKGEKALEGHKTDCRFVLIFWSIPTPIHSEDHRQLTENRGGRCVEMLALKIKARHGAVIWGLGGKRTRDSSCLRGRIKIDQTAEN